MRFDLHLRESFKSQVTAVADQMKDWEEVPRIPEDEQAIIRESIQLIDHTTQIENLAVAGVDGSGDYPSVSYADSFVYVTVAHGTIYESNASTGLKEVPPQTDPVIHVLWMAEEAEQRRKAWDDAFTDLGSMPLGDAIQRSDYRTLKSAMSGKSTSVEQLVEQLIRPHAHDSANIAIQLRSLGELGAAHRIIQAHDNLDFVLIDGTLSLPLVTRRDVSLYHEHIKRLCCVEATSRGIGLFAVSKSHGLPSIELVEQLAKEKAGLQSGRAEHWFLRLPVPNHDSWNFSLLDGRNLPPAGAVTYLVRLHKNVPVLRLDMDRNYWNQNVVGDSEEATAAAERQIFQSLDYASHDQRCFGYPYPIKAGHDRASLTSAERKSLRKQIVDAAVERGLKRSLFRDASIATGHG